MLTITGKPGKPQRLVVPPSTEPTVILIHVHRPTRISYDAPKPVEITRDTDQRKEPRPEDGESCDIL